jgi:serine/threonine-protein kinase
MQKMTVSENQKIDFPNKLLKEAEFDRLVSFSKSLVDTKIEQARGHDLLPQTFGNYKLTRVLGQGEMGRVYLAEGSGLREKVALRMIHPRVFAGVTANEIDNLTSQFRKDCRAAAMIDLDNVVSTFDIGEVDGRYFYSMNYLKGNCLSKLILSNTLSNREAAETVKAIAESIHRLHNAGIFHRDLKTSNIIMDVDRRPHILGVGVATLRSMSPSEMNEHSNSLGFKAPEVIADPAALDAAAEVWSLGAILYECLVGDPPFSCRYDSGDTLKRLLKEDPVTPRKRNPNVAASLETICLKCLRKNPSNRYASAAKLAEDLDRFLDYQPIAASPVSLLQRGWNSILRRPS